MKTSHRATLPQSDTNIPPVGRSLKKRPSLTRPYTQFVLGLILLLLPLLGMGQTDRVPVKLHFLSKDVVHNFEEVPPRTLIVTVSPDTVYWFDIATNSLQEKRIIAVDTRGNLYLEWDTSPAVLQHQVSRKKLVLYYPGHTYVYHYYRAVGEDEFGTLFDIN